MGRTLSWEKGRQLASNVKDGVTTTYKYDINGLRTEKKIGDRVHSYTYVDDKLYAYEVGKEDAKTKQIDVEQRMFFYDENETPSALVYNGSTYYYQTNLQGDVTGIVNYAGTKVASYSYDAWGNPVGQQHVSGVGYYNPLRYRGYVYDADTNWYYLQSRYYDPETGRFLNADAPEMFGVGESVLSYNLFSYCENDPVNWFDPSGEIPLILIGIVLGAIIGGTAGYALSRILNVPKGKRWKYVLGGAVIGAVIGGCIGYAVGVSGGSGIVLWSGGGMEGAGGTAMNFAAKNGLKTLEMTKKGKLLSLMDKLVKSMFCDENKAREFMKPFWRAASSQFVKATAGGQEYVHVFISASLFREGSVFADIEYKLVRELGMKIIWHFIK